MKFLKLGLLTFVFFCSCDYYEMAKGVRKDFQGTHLKSKKLFIGIAFKGVVLEKTLFERCDESKYRIRIKMTSHSPEITSLGDKLFPPFYSFGEEDKLKFIVTERLFNLLTNGDLVMKESGSTDLIIDRIKYPFLSRKRNIWLVTYE